MPLSPDSSVARSFDLSGRVAAITGGSGLLGQQHAMALAECGAQIALLDIHAASLERACEEIAKVIPLKPLGFICDITSEVEVAKTAASIEQQCGAPAAILINNAANNPKMEARQDRPWSRLENFPLEVWEKDLSVGLRGAFLCSRTFGARMAALNQGVILNIASDLALIGPDQRIYQQQGVAADSQPVKPVTYSVVKAGLVGLTRYLATYWAGNGVRVNAICPGGVENNQDPLFMEKLTRLIPLGRMASPAEYRSAIAFLCSDASSYMTGAIVSVDGGRTAW